GYSYRDGNSHLSSLESGSLRSLTASEVLDSSFVLNWEILDDSVRCGHALDICATSTVSDDRYCSLNATGNQWQVTGLQPCSRYNVGATLTVDSQVLPPKNLSVFTASYSLDAASTMFYPEPVPANPPLYLAPSDLWKQRHSTPFWVTSFLLHSDYVPCP
ncbi:unnamed protein product, partial [Timema podura]|nr:unnamed protein product [Timema podura]